MNQVSASPNKALPRHFDEKVYRRQTLAEWDQRWHLLSSLARYFVLNHLRLPVGPTGSGSAACAVSTGTFPSGIIDELSGGGFVKVQPGAHNGLHGQVVISDGLEDFGARTYTLRRFHLLADDLPSELAGYVNHVYFVNQFTDVLSGVLGAVGVASSGRIDDLLTRYVVDHRWPSWVARSLSEPLADRIIDVVRKAKGTVRLCELPERIVGADPNKVRAVVDKLVARLALVEGIRPSSWELMVGFLPAVRENMIIASMARERPALLTCASPRELGPDGSPIVNDLRAILIEVASQPPRLRQDQNLFHKEIGRFQTALDPLAAWLLIAMNWSAEGRPNRAIAWARALDLANVAPEGKEIRLHLTHKGQAWLAGGAAEDSLEILQHLRAPEGRFELYWPQLELFLADMDPWENLGPADVRFLGTHVVAIEVGPGKRPPHYAVANRGDHMAVRKHLDMAMAQLEPGVFYQLESVKSRLVFADHNPLNLALPAERVALFWVNRPVPAGRPQREEIGRLVIHDFVLRRLVPFGCFQAAIDAEGRICVARGPRYDAYFGREVPRPDPAFAANAVTRVVVQPDFSVVIIGPNPAPAAALAPFCDRTNRGGGQGSMVLQLTRESVVKAVKNGLKPGEIMARLERHASKDIPANVDAPGPGVVDLGAPGQLFIADRLAMPRQ